MEDERFQLLEHPVSIKDLQNLVVLDQETISIGIMPETLSQCISLPSSSLPTTKIEIVSTRNDMEISASLREDDEDMPDSTDNKNDSNNNSLTLIQWKEEKITIHAALPTKGTFPLKIYSAEKNRDDNTRSLRLLYNLTTEHEVNEPEFIGYPKVYEKTAAESEFLLLMDETPNTHNCKTANKIEMKLKMKRNVRYRHSICEGKVKQQTENRLKCYTHLTRDKNNPNICCFTVLFPKPGWWTVFLISDTNYRLMRYQVYATIECKTTLYPHIITDAAEALGIALQDELTPISYDSNRPFKLKFTALTGLDYKAKLIKVDEFGNESEEEVTSLRQHRTYILCPSEGTCTACVYAIIPPGTWCLDLYANEPQFDKLKHVISAKLLYGSEDMKLKVFPQVYSSFSSMSLTPPPNLEDWVLPEVVVGSDYPKTIKISFIQFPSEVQLSCSVKHDDQQVFQTQDLAKLITNNDLSNHVHIPHKNRMLEVVISKRGKWTFALQGRNLQEYSSITTLMEYTVRGL